MIIKTKYNLNEEVCYKGFDPITEEEKEIRKVKKNGKY
jgi:hypothetical protein